MYFETVERLLQGCDKVATTLSQGCYNLVIKVQKSVVVVFSHQVSVLTCQQSTSWFTIHTNFFTNSQFTLFILKSE